MKPLYFIAIFTLAWLMPKAQEIDSLERVLLQLDKEDSVKVQLLNQLGYEYWIVNPIQSIIYGQQAKALAIVIGDNPGLAFSNRVIGVANWAQGSYDDGLIYLFDALALYQSLSDTLGEGNCLMNIGLIYGDQSDDDKALEFYFKALHLFETIEASGRSATTYTKIATIFIDQLKLDLADEFLGKSLKIHNEQQFEYGRMEVFNRMGLLYAARNQNDSAIYYLTQSLEISNTINDIEGKTKTLLDLATVYLSQNQLALAENALQDGLITAREIGSDKWLNQIYNNLQLLHRKRGDLNKAIYYYDQYIQVRDSLFNQETVSNISRLESQLATIEQKRQIDAKEQQIVILEQQAELQNTRIFILVILIVVILVGTWLFIRRRQALVKLREEKAKEIAENARRDIEYKNRELSSYTVNFVQKNRLFEDLIDSIQEIKKSTSDEARKDLIGIEKIVKRHIQVDQDWKDFKLRFENVHKGFFEKLHEKFPSLTNNDIRLSVLVKMNFSIKEIGEMFGISPESVKTARYRLKKKLNLPSEQNLNDFLNEIS